MADTSAAAPRERAAEAIGRLWWLPLARGVLFIVLGAYALISPGMTAAVFAQVIGFFIILDGAFLLAAGIFGEVPSRGWIIVRGLIEILAGVFVFAHPSLIARFTGLALVYMLAVTAILSGVMEIIAAIRDRKEIEGEGWMILGGVLTVIFGVILLAVPLSFGALMIRVLGAFVIISSISTIVFAFRLRRVGKEMKQRQAVTGDG